MASLHTSIARVNSQPTKDLSFGSIWSLLDSIIKWNWKGVERDPKPFVPRPHGEHPILIVDPKRGFGASEIVTAFIGVSKPRSEAFMVCDLEGRNSADRFTYFFDALRPLPPKLFSRFENGRPVANQSKYRKKLDDEEQDELRDWLRDHGGRT